jgi:hypothetical protein
MPVSHEKRIVFVHIPKNAGTTVTRILGIEHTIDNLIGFQNGEEIKMVVGGNSCTLQHLTYSQILNLHPDLKAYTAFAVSRNPYDRMVSVYKMQQLFKNRHQLHKPDYSFMDLLESIYYNWDRIINPSDIGQINTCHFVPQHFYTENIPVVLRFENLDKGMSAILGYNSILPKLNSAENKKKHLEFYSKYPLAKLVVKELYSEDFERFGYKKEII